MVEIKVNTDYHCDLTSSIVSQGASQFIPVLSTTFEERRFIHANNEQNFVYADTQLFKMNNDMKLIISAICILVVLLFFVLKDLNFGKLMKEYGTKEKLLE